MYKPDSLIIDNERIKLFGQYVNLWKIGWRRQGVYKK